MQLMASPPMTWMMVMHLVSRKDKTTWNHHGFEFHYVLEFKDMFYLYVAKAPIITRPSSARMSWNWNACNAYIHMVFNGFYPIYC